jgi:hypothetical protein
MGLSIINLGMILSEENNEGEEICMARGGEFR